MSHKNVLRHRLGERIGWFALTPAFGQLELSTLERVVYPKSGGLYLPGLPKVGPMANAYPGLRTHECTKAQVLAIALA